MTKEYCEDCGLEIDYDLRADGQGTEAYHVGTGLKVCEPDFTPIKSKVDDLLKHSALNLSEAVVQWDKYPNPTLRDLSVAVSRINEAMKMIESVNQ